MLTPSRTTYGDLVPNQPATPKHGVRTPDERWKAFGANAQRQGTDRTKLLNAFMAWYNREEGVELPERPPAED
ncbi:hypothetical protein Plo01_25470 [Planobispora longispora]|uniref:Uncharacterized protein n=1 Tax=Planobispora longispora TaxID=28887 RepID=A0A8J3RJH1_9ACTN|nr:hypothetical protein GCM10020093_084570 [Planobispora longispora]GIH76118.1 hypothetical protein Plo01_25470 [Planobispora longispora]